MLIEKKKILGFLYPVEASSAFQYSTTTIFPVCYILLCFCFFQKENLEVYAIFSI